MEILAVLFILYVVSRMVSLTKHRNAKSDPTPKCDLCNDEPVYLGRAQIACPKCKKGAN